MYLDRSHFYMIQLWIIRHFYKAHGIILQFPYENWKFLPPSPDELVSTGPGSSGRVASIWLIWLSWLSFSDMDRLSFPTEVELALTATAMQTIRSSEHARLLPTSSKSTMSKIQFWATACFNFAPWFGKIHGLTLSSVMMDTGRFE